MSYNVFFASDHHFGHEALYSKFLDDQGRFTRYQFASASEGDEAMVERHNSVVRTQDRVYFLGDVTFHKKYLSILNRMNGRKVLIKGNHDNLTLKDYAEYFDDIRGIHQFKGLVMTHVPIHTESLARWRFNVHGHLHTNVVKLADGTVDTRYLCVCMEQINYTPISLEDVRKKAPHADIAR